MGPCISRRALQRSITCSVTSADSVRLFLACSTTSNNAWRSNLGGCDSRCTPLMRLGVVIRTFYPKFKRRLRRDIDLLEPTQKPLASTITPRISLSENALQASNEKITITELMVFSNACLAERISKA